MGVKKIPPSEWLLPNDPEQLSRRAQLLDERRGEVIMHNAVAEPAIEELAVMVADHLLLDDDAFVWDPLDQIGRAACEDFCVMIDQGDGPRLEAAVLCFPSHWRLAEKLGNTMMGIHEPVTGYSEELDARADTFMDRMDVDSVFCRRNWSLQGSAELFAPSSPPAVSASDLPRSVAEVGVPAWLRSERQTLRRLPGTRAIVFTIRTQQVPLALLKEHPDVADRLDRWMAVAPIEMLLSRCAVV
jgi:hypothetical protein